MRDTIHGFYRHQQFRLVADPFGYLDVCRFRIKNAERNIPAIFKVPIRDRLGVLNEIRSTSDLDLVTRFEVAGPGDVPEQVEAVTVSAGKHVCYYFIRWHFKETYFSFDSTQSRELLLMRPKIELLPIMLPQ